jgi:preprotein translocase subunit YajC
MAIDYPMARAGARVRAIGRPTVGCIGIIQGYSPARNSPPGTKLTDSVQPMLISPAYAQGAAAPGAADIFMQIMPIVAIIAIMYFLVFRPQQQRVKAHRQMVDNTKRGDVVVTSGGIVGKIIKVLEGDEVLIEIAENVRVKVIKSTIADVRSKSEPADAKSKADNGDDKK